ncbi:hypothetical protein [Sphingobium sp. CECT 9361]|uniref:hypothetical protein n=1 Tax=Sphingobium sp. CECT 9361 TaxID=2845384 RepID=UPI001E44EF6E|nr:hypothetical protein [Sphingobium sp. CECT 9361]CAH0350059.1 hypothetical protein SPH9361_00918 [Sphingobium sp. CECT 9361]
MAFVSDGERTWDADRGLELKVVRGGAEFIHFEMTNPIGSIRFYGDWIVEQSRNRRRSSLSANANNIIKWHLIWNACLPGEDEDQTNHIISEAMRSFETYHGLASKNGHPPYDVVCVFGSRG